MAKSELTAPPESWDEKKLKFFSPFHEFQIKDMAKGLSKGDILNWFGLEEDDLEKLSSYDQWFFNVSFKRGRVEGLQKSVDNLFQQQRDKGGTAACLAHLTRFAEEWPAKSEDEEDGNKILKFSVNMGDK